MQSSRTRRTAEEPVAKLPSASYSETARGTPRHNGQSMDNPNFETASPVPQPVMSSRSDQDQIYSTSNNTERDDVEAEDDDDSNETTPSILQQPSLSKSLTSRLYISHFLSTWNSRLFEFGSVLFLASIFPNTLLPMSVYALCRNGAAIVLSPSVGSLIDNGDRLAVVRVSIIGQRLAVAVSCAVFWILVERKQIAGPNGRTLRGIDGALFGVLVVLACVEKLSSVMNLVSVERDWVVVITEGNETARRVLNARMRRIDLFCKLMGPLTISLIDGASTMVAVWVTLGLSVASVLVEYFCIARVFKLVPTLRRQAQSTGPDAVPDIEMIAAGLQSDETAAPRFMRMQSVLERIFPVRSIPFYFSHPAFFPSFALALLYLTVLSFSGQMITFLLATGYTSIHVGIARTVSTVFELSATWAAPHLMKRIGPVRGGIWFLCWQMAWLAGGASMFFASGDQAGDSKSRSTILAASGLVGGVILSRVGLWGFDLCAQSIVQDEVVEDQRGAFSAVEASLQNLFELLAYATTIAFSRPDQFRWPVVISVVAVYIAGGLYAAFVRQRRGHLLHAPQCLHPKTDE